MKRIHPPEETSSEFYALPTKHLKLTMKVTPGLSALQTIKDSNLVVINSGDKVLLFDVAQGLREGTSGLQQVQTNSQIMKRCKFYPLFNKK